MEKHAHIRFLLEQIYGPNTAPAAFERVSAVLKKYRRQPSPTAQPVFRSRHRTDYLRGFPSTTRRKTAFNVSGVCRHLF